MKKLLLVSLLLSLFLIGCKQEEVSEVSSIEDDLEDTEEVVNEVEVKREEKENELLLTINGVERVIPAVTYKDVNEYIEEIKLPADSEYFIDKHEGAFIMKHSDVRFSILRKKTDSGNTNLLRTNFRRMMELSEPDRMVPVIDVELSTYPELMDYDGMLKVEGANETIYYLAKMNTPTQFEEVKLRFPKSENEELELATMLAILRSLK